MSPALGLDLSGQIGAERASVAVRVALFVARRARDSRRHTSGAAGRAL